MQTVETVRQQLKDLVRPVMETEEIQLISAIGRTIPNDVLAKIQVPPYDNSAMDGYALNAIDAEKNLTISQRIPAGSVPSDLEKGTAARIFTGAQIPNGADSVIEQESVTILDDGKIKLNRKIILGQHIRRAGEDIDLGQKIITKGKILTAADLALLASLGIASLQVKRKLRVAVFFTGDELIEPGEKLEAGKIYNSNRYWLIPRLTTLGFEVQDFGIVPDDFQITCETIQKASKNADVIITCGGVSVGEEDHVKAAVSSVGELTMWKIAMKPGKPLAYGRIADCDFIGLPGNPVSSFVVFEILIKIFLLLRSGASSARNPEITSIRSMFSWHKTDKKREEYLRVRKVETNGEWQLQNYTNQGSGVLTSCAWAEGLARIAPGQDVNIGDWLDFIPL